MADRSTSAVLTGLAVGIALILLFGSFFTPERPRGDEINNFNIYRTLVDDTTFTIPYRFSDVRQDRIVNMTVHQFGIDLHVAVPRGSTLEIQLPNELLDKLEASDPRLSTEELVVFVDGINQDGGWVYANNQTIGFIELEAGAEKIEILGTVLI